MSNLSSIIESMIASFLGPCKNQKLIVEGEEMHVVKCPQPLLGKSVLMGHLSYLIENTIQSHHKVFGCSTTSLLSMWYFWNKEFQSLLSEGYDAPDIIKYSQNIFDDVVNLLPQMTVNVEQLLLRLFNTEERRHSDCNSKNSKTFLKKQAAKPDDIPTGVCYSSRHLSPISVQSESVNHASDFLQMVQSGAAFRRTVSAVVRQLSHDDTEWSDVVSEVWFQQISFSHSLKFSEEVVTICPLMLPSSYTSEIEGLVVKSKLPPWYDQSNFLESKSLIIKGSITFEPGHQSRDSSMGLTRKLNSNDVTFSAKDVWVKNCLALLTKLKVNIVLAHGSVDPALSDSCSFHSILILSNIPRKEMTALCNAARTSPCSYLLDCNYKDVSSNILVREYRPRANALYAHITVVSSAVKLSTVILCHPNPDVLKCQEHQLCHIISRVKLVSSMHKILPGGGKTEEHIFLKMKQFSFNNDLKNKVSAAIANGFERYSDLVSKKLKMKDDPSEDRVGRLKMKDDSREALDEGHSKVQAWLSALALVHLTLQCDSVIISELNNVNGKECNHNLIGIL